MHRLALALICAASLCVGKTRCPNQRLRYAVVRGDTIAGSVVRRNKPLMFAPVRLYSSSGKAAWIGTTDMNGRFAVRTMPQGEYRLDVRGWGSAKVELKPESDQGSGGKMPIWKLFLTDNACVITAIEF